MEKLIILIFLCLLIHYVQSVGKEDFSRISAIKDELASRMKHQSIDIDFENGTIEPWSECSEVGTHWIIENNSSWTNEMRTSLKIPPPPNNGSYFLLLKHELDVFGIGQLNSPIFLAHPGDRITFSYWLKSKYRHFNNIEVFWSVENQIEEQKIMELFQESSTDENLEWRFSSVEIPINQSTKGNVILYGYCNFQDNLGGIAIDEIALFDESSTITPLYDSTSLTSPTPTDATDHFTTENPVSIVDSTLILVTKELQTMSTMVDPTKLCFDGIYDFYPCTCYLTGSEGTEPNVDCNNVSLIEVRDVFSKVDRLSLTNFHLHPPDNESVPEYFLGMDGVEYILFFELKCDYVHQTFLEVDPLAFKNNVSTFITNLDTFDCNFKNFDFLKGLEDGVNSLSILGSLNINETLGTIPDDFTMLVLGIFNSNLLGLVLNPFPQIRPDLMRELRVCDNEQISDETIDVLVNWMLQTSKDSLVKFYTYNNGLKKIPSGLWRFNRLTYFRFDRNILEPGIVFKGDLKFSDYIIAVMVSNCGIHTIEAGAFQGIYEAANVYLDGNSLTRFDSDVYLPILEQMIDVEGGIDNAGFINVEGNPFDCVEDPCHLTWLLRDTNRTFLPFIWNAACANGTLFDDIQPDDPMFKDCP